VLIPIIFRHCRYLVCRANAEHGIIEDGALLIEGSRIAAAGPDAEVAARAASLPRVESVDARDLLVLPGLVDAHNHVGEAHTLLIPGRLPAPITDTMDAMDRIYWPAYAWLTEESAYDLTLLGLVNCLKHGATTHADAMIFPDAIYRASVEAGARTIIHPQMISSVRLPDAAGEADYLAQTEDAIRSYHNAHDGLIRLGVHPNALFNASSTLLTRGMELARKYGVQFATHIAETPEEKSRADATWTAQGGLIGFMRALDLLGPETLLFHGTLLEEREIDVLAETGASLVHCPATNSWFGYCARLPYMLRAGVRVGLGTDCTTHNLFSAMLSAMQHANIMPREPRGLDAQAAFELSTLGGARALGLEDEIGSLEPGKRADIITIDLSRNTSLFPLSSESLFSILVLNGAGAEARDVLIDGVFVRRGGAFTRLDEEAILARARRWCERFEAYYTARAHAGSPMFERVAQEFQPPAPADLRIPPPQARR
jgi:5-methylthioadenosine/S-adenosylhomocysteine deaminase